MHASSVHGSSTSCVSNTSSRTFFGCERNKGGVMLFTGPDAIRDHRVTVEPEHRYVGEGTMSPEGTSEVAYLWRAPVYQPHPRPKSSCVGEVGWAVPQLTDWSYPQTGKQIQLGEFRQAVEDRTTHLYQNAWYPSPNQDSNMSNNIGNGSCYKRGGEKQNQNDQGSRIGSWTNPYSSMRPATAGGRSAYER